VFPGEGIVREGRSFSCWIQLKYSEGLVKPTRDRDSAKLGVPEVHMGEQQILGGPCMHAKKRASREVPVGKRRD